VQDRVLKVLWIDTDAAEREALLSQLSGQKDFPLDIIHAPDIPSSLNALNNGNFDVILLDISLPGVSSSAGFEEIRNRAPMIPVIFLVGPDREAELKQILLKGAQDYLLKDRLDSGTLLRSLRYAAEWRRSALEMIRKNSELEAIFSVLPDLYFRINLEGVILDYKAKRVSDLYVPPDFFLGKRAEEILPADVARKFQEALQRIRGTKEPSAIEYWLPDSGKEK